MPKCPNLVIGIGASAGGLQAISQILESLPESLQATIIIANHRDPRSPSELANIIRRCTRLTVIDAKDDLPIECTTVYLGSPVETVEVEGEDAGANASLDVDVKISPIDRLQRIDDLFRSVAEVAGRNAVGVVLSGMLSDGVEGLKAIKDAGGTCIVQDPVEAQYKSMPRRALELVGADFVGTSLEIGSFLTELATEKECR